MSEVRIAVVVPDRCDRPGFTKNCLRMIDAQTLRPVRILHVDYPAKSNKCDITERYRTAYEIISGMTGVDLIAFLENDDYYCPQYLEYMAEKWKTFHKPDLFGTVYTIYYHLKIRKYFTFRHEQRSSMMSTMIKPGLKFTWPMDHDPYTDQWLWMRSGLPTRVVFEPEKIICVSMKHGFGKCGGDFHIDNRGDFRRYIHHDVNPDYPKGFLFENLDPESFKFYSSLKFPEN